MSESRQFDQLVGQVAGAIYIDINAQFPLPPLMLVPAVTFKVRKILEQITDVSLLNDDQRAELARDIQVSIVPMLFTYELEAKLIKQLSPTIETAAFRALSEAA